MSIILGTVALSYGSVPMYKMVIAETLPRGNSWLIQTALDLPTNRLGRATHQSLYTFVGRGSCFSSAACNIVAKTPDHIQWLSLRHHALEIYSTAEGGPCVAWGDGTGIFHGNEQERRGHHRGGHL